MKSVAHYCGRWSGGDWRIRRARKDTGHARDESVSGAETSCRYARREEMTSSSGFPQTEPLDRDMANWHTFQGVSEHGRRYKNSRPVTDCPTSDLHVA